MKKIICTNDKHVRKVIDLIRDTNINLDSGCRIEVETIFREQLNGEEFLYWYSIQGEGGISVEDSESWIDKNI